MSNTGAISGAASGAAQGFAVGGPWGAVIGGVVGGLGGMFSDDAAKYMRKAEKMREEASLIQNFLERRQLVQQYQIARSSIMAGGLATGAGIESSGIQGAQASTRAQTVSTLDKNAYQVRLGISAANWTRKAGKKAEMGGMIQSGLSAGMSIYGAASTPGSGYSASAQRAGTGTYQSIPRPIYAGGGVPGLPTPTTVNTSPFASRGP